MRGASLSDTPLHLSTMSASIGFDAVTGIYGAIRVINRMHKYSRTSPYDVSFLFRVRDDTEV